MKLTLSLALLFLVSFPNLAAALEPISAKGLIFDLANGVYTGSGILRSQTFLVPDIDYSSVRQLSKGLIIANTTASIMNMNLAQAAARLKVVPTSATQFILLDIDAGNAKAGAGSCDASSCTFQASVMNGSLKLKETWIPTANGFQIINASQVFNGAAATYNGSFSLKNL